MLLCVEDSEYIEYWGEYLDLRERRWREAGEEFASPDILRAIKLRMMRWAGQVSRMGDMRIAYKTFWLENVSARSHVEVLGVDTIKLDHRQIG
jgi:hypothetical protein